ncbi:hypothetical protein D1610_09640 [Sphingomonas gilva]|uniref:Tetratricopeptide repeat protein n=1 Tax=Sphingomonas gilva TaxID=2305907 RepID=A0A396RVJ1_9SPHN|nr:hypothetical protein D1610_09640 [Sphingomonas gilva]
MPDAARVAATLAAIYASPEFTRAPVMRHLLGYLVDETLAGRGDRLKAYSVAVDALGRGADFDAQADSYPRVQVGRLRRMLDAFYAAGADVPLRISIPLGAYRVLFADEGGDGADAPPASQDRDRERPRPALDGRIPSAAILLSLLLALAALGVVSWLHWGRGSAPAALQPAVVPPPTISIESGETAQSPAERARIADVTRRAGAAFTRSRIATVAYGAAAVDARYTLLLDLGTDGVSLSMRLIDRRTGMLEWSEMVTLPEDPAQLAEAIRPDISALVRPSGIIAARQRTELNDDYRPGYPCLLHYDRYFRERAPELREPVAACVARTIALDPNHVEALAAASFIAVDPAEAPISAEMRGRALALARRASAANPYSPAALVAEARIAFMEGNCVRGGALASRAVDLGRHDPETLGLIGMLLVRCDRPRALELLRSARALDPDLTTFYVSALVLLELDAGRPAEAAAIADAMRPPGRGMLRQYLVAQTLGAIARGQEDQAQARWRRLVALTPRPRDTIDQVLSYSYLAPDYRAMLIERLRAGGIADGDIAPSAR